MSKFIDKLTRLSRAEPQPIGFRTKQPTAPSPKIQLLACLAQEDVKDMADYVAGADAVLLCISKPGTGVKSLPKISRAFASIPWGVRLQDSNRKAIEPLLKAGCDFIVFPAASTPLAVLQNEEVGKILQVPASLNEGLLRAANELPVNAVLISDEEKGPDFLTWQHLMLFKRFANLLSRPALVPVPSNVTTDELKALWEAGVTGVVMEVTAGQSPERFKELRQAIDKLTFPSPHRREKIEPLLPRASRETNVVTTEEDEDEEE